jgi:hypothetical protein
MPPTFAAAVSGHQMQKKGKKKRKRGKGAGGEKVAGKVDNDRRMKNENRLYNDRKLASR